MARRSTAQDVADLAGVSRSTVSLVLNERAAGNVSTAKQAAVREAAKQLRYTPNAVALSLRRQRTTTIGILTWAGPGGKSLSLLGAVYEAAASSGYLLLSGNVEERPEVVDTLLDRQVDGFLVVAPELVGYRRPDSLATASTLLLNCFDPVGGVTALVPDEQGAGSAAAGLVIGAGHTRIGVLASADDSLQSRRRVLGICEAAAAAGLPPPTVVNTGQRDIGAGHEAACQLLQTPQRPTAVVTTHERLAVGAALAAAELGLDIPGALSLVSLDDGEDLARDLVPPLTLVQRPDAVMAEHALDLLIRMLGGEAGPARQLTFVCPVVPGASISPPPPEPPR